MRRTIQDIKIIIEPMEDSPPQSAMVPEEEQDKVGHTLSTEQKS